jgi:hypothetical protein
VRVIFSSHFISWQHCYSSFAIKELQSQSITSYNDIARTLDARGIPTAKHKMWYGAMLCLTQEARPARLEQSGRKS